MEKGAVGLRNFEVLTEAIGLIEANLTEPFHRQEIADTCHVSLSSLEKLFRYALRLSMKEYVLRRQMTQAARDIAKEGFSVTETAMKYQFNSVEVFSRAFKRVWNVNPSSFVKHWRFTGLFPKINYEYREGEDSYMARKRVDLSEAYDYFRAHKGSWVVCFDMQGLDSINRNIAHQAGDLAILEMASRIDQAAGEEMLLMRIGGDEFALVTGLEEENKLQEIIDHVLSKNGQPVLYQGQEVPVSLWAGKTKIPEMLRYSELFTQMHSAIEKCRGA